MVNINKKREPFFNKVPDLMIRTQKVHPMIKNLFYLNIPDIPLAGRLKYFQKNWKVLTQDPKILSIVEGYDIPFVEKPYQCQIPAKAKFDKTQTQLVNQEIQDMLKKGAIEKVSPVPDQFLSNIFLYL